MKTCVHVIKLKSCGVPATYWCRSSGATTAFVCEEHACSYCVLLEEKDQGWKEVTF